MGEQSFGCEAHEETCGLLPNGIDGPTQTEPRVQNLRVPRPPFLSRPSCSSQQAPTPARQPQARNGSLGSGPFPLAPTVLPAFPRILLLALLGHPSFPCPQLCFAHTSLLSSLTLPSSPEASWFFLLAPPVLPRHLSSAALGMVRPLGLQPYLLRLSAHLHALSPSPLLLERRILPTVTTAFLYPPNMALLPRPRWKEYWLQEVVSAVTSSGQAEILFLPSLLPLSSLFSFSCTEDIQQDA